jgi:hypothetical protein
MIDRYNQYFGGSKDDYSSIISFVNANIPIVEKSLFFIRFKDNSKYKDNFYLENEELKKIYSDKRKTGKISDDRIREIMYGKRYFSYVKIIEDTYNTQLEGQVMLLMYGGQIKKIIIDYLNSNTSFKNTFRFIIKKIGGYPSFDECFFTAEELEITDFTLDINSELNYKNYSPLNVERQEKLEKLSQIKH